MASNARGNEFVIEKWLGTMLLRVVLGLLLTAALAYLVDAAVWWTRVSAHGGMGEVEVHTFVVGELKGGKEDYYPQGKSMEPCSKTLYPQGGNSACWWLARHPEQIQRY